MDDAQRWILCYRSAQLTFELFLVRVGRGQHENPMLVPLRGQRVDQGLGDIAVIANDQPGRPRTGLRSCDGGTR